MPFGFLLVARAVDVVVGPGVKGVGSAVSPQFDLVLVSLRCIGIRGVGGVAATPLSSDFLPTPTPDIRSDTRRRRYRSRAPLLAAASAPGVRWCTGCQLLPATGMSWPV